MSNLNLSKSSLKIIPLGGVGNVTKNMYVYEFGNDIVIIDCGVGFPDEGMPGIDLVIPDFSYLESKKEKIRGLLLTHGHDDHIGGLPYFIKDFSKIPIYASRLTASLVEEKFKEFNIFKKVEMLPSSGKLNLGSFYIQWAFVNHSIPEALHYLLKTPLGSVYHGGDFKFDWTPPLGKPAEIAKIAKMCEGGVLCLLSDCLGAERAGATLSEKVIEETLEKEILNCPGKFIVTTQSSNISRLKQAIEVGLRHKRKIGILGRSMEGTIEVARKLNLIQLSKENFVQIDKLDKYNPDEILLLISGSQGQESSALVRIANNDHPFLKIKSGDVVVFSSDPIPGNENNVYNLIDVLARQGARVIYTDVRDELHVSGHGSQYDLSVLINLTRPKFIFPIGGTYRHMQQYSFLAQQMGYEKKQIILGKNGQILELTNKTAFLHKKIELKNIMVDGLGVGDVGNVVLRDRKQMSADGIVVVIIPMDEYTGKTVSEPDVISRGFIYMKESEGLIEEAKKVIRQTLAYHQENIIDWKFIKSKVQDALEKFFYKRTKRRPMIVVVLIEV